VNLKPDIQARYSEILLETDLKYLLTKTGARLNLKIKLIGLHFDPGIKKSGLCPQA
jgi:hypothetical protein